MAELLHCCRIQIAGAAGDGIITAGELLMRIAVREGFIGSLVKSYPSNMQGGYTAALVTISNKPFISPVDDAAILFIMNIEPLHYYPALYECVQYCICDEIIHDAYAENAYGERHFPIVSVPVSHLVRKAGGEKYNRSALVTGVLCHILGLSEAVALQVVSEYFAEKGAHVVIGNQKVFTSGYRWALKHCVQQCLERRFGEVRKEKQLLVTGNQATALGALYAGCTFFASYPITPATSIGETLGRLLPDKGGIAYQAEDEIAALAAAIGAAYSGAKAMIATSGPGLSLIQECIGYASMTELPVVIIDVQRAGPSTGMPTKCSQDDLWASVYGGHGEGPRIVVAPHNVTDCYNCVRDAFVTASHYQCPVIVLSDSMLGNTLETIPRDVFVKNVYNESHGTAVTSELPDGERFQRYPSEDGTERTGYLPFPGDAGFSYCATGIEHDEYSKPVSSPLIRVKQMARRIHKIDDAEMLFRESVIWDGDQDGECDIAVCAWGSMVNIVSNAVNMLRIRGISVAALYPRLLYPLCSNAINRWSLLAPFCVVVEANFSGQYCTMLRNVVLKDIYSVTDVCGEPLLPRKVVSEILNIIHTRKQ